MITTIILIIVSIYVIVNVAAYFLQEKFLFKPEKLPPDFQFKYEEQTVQEHNLYIGDDVRINGVHFSVEKPKGVVMYLKGNSRSIKGWGKFAIDFNRLGFDVVMVDYRGFGKSTGRRSEREIKGDLQKVYDILKSKVKEKYIIIYGRSMGSGFAAKLASNNNPRMLVLESPYYSMQKMAKRYIPFMPASLILKFPLRTYKWIKYVECPIKIIHGTKDKLIPYKSSLSLANIKPNITRLYSVIGGGHNNLHTFEEYHRMLEEALNSAELKPIDPDKSSLNFTRNRKNKQ
ncbi:alpha/beta fold hydrolase [Ekhidna sp.]|uniref:alpha/beta hydrolase n=1 Tax=Ekhidna sp. TaxID=2608089 RepID=UPI0032F03428